MWGLPDTLRLRMVPGEIQLKSVKMVVENAYGERITVDYPVEGSGDMVTVNAPVSDFCDVADLGNFPLHLVYYYITYNTVTTDVHYSLKIPGMELIYANMPQEEAVKGDVNVDGEVNIADINTIIDMILSGNVNKLGDVNGDGEISIADINTVIDIILS